MKTQLVIGAATSSVLGFRTEEAVVARRTVPAVPALVGTGLPCGSPSDPELQRTRLPFAGISQHMAALGAYGDVMGPDQVPTTAGVRFEAVAVNKGIPPRRTPSRC